MLGPFIPLRRGNVFSVPKNFVSVLVIHDDNFDFLLFQSFSGRFLKTQFSEFVLMFSFQKLEVSKTCIRLFLSRKLCPGSPEADFVKFHEGESAFVRPSSSQSNFHSMVEQQKHVELSMQILIDIGWNLDDRN